MNCHVTNFTISCADQKKLFDLFDCAQVRIKGPKFNIWSSRRPLSPAADESNANSNNNTNNTSTSPNKKAAVSAVSIGPSCGALTVSDAEQRFPVSLFIRRSASNSSFSKTISSSLDSSPHEWIHDGQVERLKPSGKIDTVLIPGSKKQYPSDAVWNKQPIEFSLGSDFGCSPAMTITLTMHLEVSQGIALTKTVDKVLTCRASVVAPNNNSNSAWTATCALGSAPKQTSDNWPTQPVFSLTQGGMKFTPGSENAKFSSGKDLVLKADFTNKANKTKTESFSLDLKNAVEWYGFQFDPYQKNSTSIVRCDVPLPTKAKNADFPSSTVVELLMTIEDKGQASPLAASTSLGNSVNNMSMPVDYSNTPQAGSPMNNTVNNLNNTTNNNASTAIAASPSPARAGGMSSNNNNNTNTNNNNSSTYNNMDSNNASAILPGSSSASPAPMNNNATNNTNNTTNSNNNNQNTTTNPRTAASTTPTSGTNNTNNNNNYASTSSSPPNKNNNTNNNTSNDNYASNSNITTSRQDNAQTGSSTITIKSNNIQPGSVSSMNNNNQNQNQNQSSYSSSPPLPPPQILKKRHEMDLKKREKLIQVRSQLMDVEIQTIVNNFSKYDKNGDGVLDNEELSIAISSALKDGVKDPKKIKQLTRDFIDACDDNGDGKLDINEAKGALIDPTVQDVQSPEAVKNLRLNSIKSRLMEDEIQKILQNFNLHDKNKDGSLDRKELFSAVKSVLDGSVSNDKTITKLVSDIVFVCDDNGDGTITVNELKNLLAQPDPNVNAAKKASTFFSSASANNNTSAINNNVNSHQPIINSGAASLSTQQQNSLDRARHAPPMSPPSPNNRNNNNNMTNIISPRSPRAVYVGGNEMTNTSNNNNNNTMTGATAYHHYSPQNNISTTTLLQQQYQQTTEAALKVAIQRAEDAEDRVRILEQRLAESEQIKETRSRRDHESVMKVYQSARNLANICEAGVGAGDTFTVVRNSMEDAQFELSRLIRSPAVPGVVQRHLFTVQNKVLKGLEDLSKMRAGGGHSHYSNTFGSEALMLNRHVIREATRDLHNALVYLE